MQKLLIKPLSVNEAWQGKRFKTVKYKKYINNVCLILKPLKVNDEKLKVNLSFGFSSPLADIDNPIKMILDILQLKYKFNDKNIFELNVKKEIVKKGLEFIEIEILSLN